VPANTPSGYLFGQSANDPYFEAAVNAARVRTHQLAARHGLSPAEREDFQQELMLDLLEHRHQFDPAKGSPGTFTGMVSKHRAVELLDGMIKQRMLYTDFDAASKTMGAANDSEMGTSSGYRTGSFCTTWNSLYRFAALNGMRPNMSVYRQAPSA